MTLEAYRGRFPSDDAPDKGSKEWFLGWAKAAYSTSYLSYNTMFFFYRWKYFEIMDYALANQSISRFKQLFKVADNPEQAANQMNIEYTPLGMFARMRRTVLNDIGKIGYYIYVKPLDPIAENEKSQWYNTLVAKLRMREAIRQQLDYMVKTGQMSAQDADMAMDRIYNIYPELKQQPGEPNDDIELEIMKDYTYTSSLASQMKKVIDLVLANNDIKMIQKTIDEYLYDFGVCIVKDYIDSQGAIRIEVIPPWSVITNYCLKRDFSDLRYIGVVKKASYPEMIQMASPFINEEEREQIRSVQGKQTIQQAGLISPARIYPYSFLDESSVFYLDLEFLSTAEIYEEVRVNKKGNIVFGNAPRDKVRKMQRLGMEEMRTDDAVYRRKTYQCWYKCKWIIGTDIIFDFGMVTNMKRMRNSLEKAKSNFHIYAIDYYNYKCVSRTEMAMPIVDNIMLNWIKFQNELARTVPRGWAINVPALQNIPFGPNMQDMTPEQILNMFYETGILIYNSENMRGDQTKTLPIEPLQGGISPDAITYFKLIAENMNLLMQTVGAMPSSVDAARKTDQGIQMEFEANLTTLQDIIDGRKWLIEDICKDIVLRVQDVVRYIPIEGYVTALGENTIEFIRASDELAAIDFGITIKDKPSKYDKMKLEQLALDAFAKQELDAADLVIIDEMEDITAAKKLLAYKISKYKKDQIAMQATQAQIQMQQRVQEIQAQAEARIAEVNATWQNKMKYLEMQMQYQMQMRREQLAAQVHSKQQHDDKMLAAKQIIHESRQQMEREKLEAQQQQQQNV